MSLQAQSSKAGSTHGLLFFLVFAIAELFHSKKEINQVEIILIAMHSMHYNAVQCAQSPGGESTETSGDEGKNEPF